MTVLDMTFERRLEIARMEAEEMKAEATAAGMAEGIAEGKREDILDVLSEYGTVPEDIKEHIASVTDPEQLKKLLKTAIKAHSIEAFASMLELQKSAEHN